MVNKIDIVKNTIIGGLQEFFSVPANQISTGYSWNQDITKTNIVISDMFNEIGEILNYRPALVFQMGNLRPITGIHPYFFWDKVYQKFEEVILNEGTAVIGCICREGLSAQRLGEITKGILESYAESFIGYNKLHRLDNVSINSEVPITLPPNNSMIMVAVPFQFSISDHFIKENYSRHPLLEIKGSDLDSGVEIFKIKDNDQIS